MLLINFYVRLGAMFWVARSSCARTVENKLVQHLKVFMTNLQKTYPLVMTNIAMEAIALIEIDDFPS